MSKAEILDEIPKLTAEEREEIRRKLDELDDALTAEEWALVDQRLTEHEADPQSAMPIEETAARVRRAVDLRARGISEAQAADLRGRLSAFAEDWNRPEMDIYDQDPAR